MWNMSFVCPINNRKKEIRKRQGKEVEDIHNKIPIHVCTCLCEQWFTGTEGSHCVVVASMLR